MTHATISAFPRKAVDKALATMEWSRLTNKEVAFLVEEWPTETDSYELAWRVVRQRQKLTPIVTTDAEVQDPEVARFIWAKSLLVAIDAASHDGVSAFRDEVLHDRLLALQQVADWIDAQAESDGLRTTYVTGTPIVDAASATSLPMHIEVRAHGFFVESVDFARDDGWVDRRPVARGGVLDRLRVLAHELAINYPWQPAQASTFVLTGATPLVTALRVEVPGFTLTDRRLITLEIDADIPVDLVADAYSKARQELLGPRPRRPTSHGTDLVIHGAERQGYSTGRLWNEWKDSHPERPYPDLRQFRQAWKAAKRRTLGTPKGHRKPTGVRGRAAL